MKIAFCCDDKFAMACGVAMLSIIDSNPNSNVDFFVLCDNVTDISKNKLKSISTKKNFKVTFLDITDDTFAGLKVSKIFPRSIYFRLLLPNLLVKESKVLYLDCDTIVCNSLNELWNIDIMEKACGIVQDQKGDDIRNYNRLEIPTDSRYFNSGVILFNLDFWRENNLTEKCIEFISKFPEKCLYPDQDALNVVLLGTVKHLSFKYNLQKDLLVPEQELMIDRMYWEDVRESVGNPVIYHFTEPFKPWNKGCPNPLTSEWLRIKEKSPWSDAKLEPFEKLPLWFRCLRKLTNYSRRFINEK